MRHEKGAFVWGAFSETLDISDYYGMAGGPGFEPRLTESESAVLPLNYPPPKLLINSRFLGSLTNLGQKFYKLALSRRFI